MELIGSIIRLEMISPSELMKLEPREIKKIIEDEIEAENINSLGPDNIKPLIKKIIRRVIIGGNKLPKIHKGLYVWYHDDISTSPRSVVIDCIYLKTRLWIMAKGKKVEAVDFAYRGEDGRYKWVNNRFRE